MHDGIGHMVHPSWAGTPPKAGTPPRQVPLGRYTPTPQAGTPPSWSMSGRYASYWNAFLFINIFVCLSIIDSVLNINVSLSLCCAVVSNAIIVVNWILMPNSFLLNVLLFILPFHEPISRLANTLICTITHDNAAN